MPLFKKKLANADGIAGPATGVSASSTQRPESNSFLPSWILGLRALQFLVALLVLGLASYAEHVWHVSGKSEKHFSQLSKLTFANRFMLPMSQPSLLPS